MQYILTLLLLLSSLQADKIIKKSLACPSMVLLEKAPLSSELDMMKLNMYAIANNCVVLTKNDSVKAMEYNANNSKKLFQKILYKKTGAILYVKSSAMIVEQDGKKSSWRF